MHAHAADDLGLLAAVRVVHQHLHEEAVALRLGQRVHALALDRVLRGEHDERVGHVVGDAADRDVALGHHLEQRRLHLRRRTVDLVGEHDVGEDRAELDVEPLLRRAVDAGAHQVGRHEVGGELEAGERAADDRGHGLRGERLGEARRALEQAVPAGEPAHEEPLDHEVLADEDALGLEHGGLEPAAGDVGGHRRHRRGCRRRVRGGVAWSAELSGAGSGSATATSRASSSVGSGRASRCCRCSVSGVGEEGSCMAVPFRGCGGGSECGCPGGGPGTRMRRRAGPVGASSRLEAMGGVLMGGVRDRRRRPWLSASVDGATVVGACSSRTAGASAVPVSASASEVPAPVPSSPQPPRHGRRRRDRDRGRRGGCPPRRRRGHGGRGHVGRSWRCGRWSSIRGGVVGDGDRAGAGVARVAALGVGEADATEGERRGRSQRRRGIGWWNASWGVLSDGVGGCH